MGISYPVNKDFFKVWGQEMAYTLGYLYADGSLEDASYIRGKYIRVSSVEIDNISKIKMWLESGHSIVTTKPSSVNAKGGYLLRIGSHELYDDLVNLGLHPKKSLDMRLPFIPKRLLCHFIRGYFDGDGCVRLSTAKGILQKLSTVFTSGSSEFLYDLAIQIHKMTGVKQLKVYNGNRSYMLSYSTADSVKVFKFMYGKVKKPVFLERKALIYKDYFELKPKRVDKKVKSILQYIG